MPETTDAVEMQWRYVEETGATGDAGDCRLQVLRIYRQLCEPLDLFQDFVVLVHRDTYITQYLTQ